MLRLGRCGSKWKAEPSERTDCRGRELGGYQAGLSECIDLTKETILSHPFIIINTTNFKNEINSIIFSFLLNASIVTKGKKNKYM